MEVEVYSFDTEKTVTMSLETFMYNYNNDFISSSNTYIKFVEKD